MEGTSEVQPKQPLVALSILLMLTAESICGESDMKARSGSGGHVHIWPTEIRARVQLAFAGLKGQQKQFRKQTFSSSPMLV